MKRISFTMRDLIIRKTRMLLVQEKFRNERISEVTTRHQLDGMWYRFTMMSYYVIPMICGESGRALYQKWKGIDKYEHK